MRRSERLVPLSREDTVLDTPWRKFAVFAGILAAVLAMLALSYFGRGWL